jgi:hypothetical protein
MPMRCNINQYTKQPSSQCANAPTRQCAKISTMKKIITGLYLLSLIFIGCQSAQNENNDSSETKKDSIQAAESIRTNLSFLHDFSALETVFTNDNWLIVDKKDSSYLYMSRVNDYLVNTYAYRLLKGDSAKVAYGTIKAQQNDLTWQFQNQPLRLTSATGTRAVWTVIGNDSLTYTFIRLDKDHIRLTYPDKKEVTLLKTLPFSLFLVRSRYDYANGTHYAFDTTQFNRKR